MSDDVGNNNISLEIIEGNEKEEKEYLEQLEELKRLNKITTHLWNNKTHFKHTPEKIKKYEHEIKMSNMFMLTINNSNNWKNSINNKNREKSINNKNIKRRHKYKNYMSL